MGFFIVSTLTGLYYVGFIHRNYNRYDLFDDLVKIGNIYIPRSNIDYIKVEIPYDKYVTTCRRLGIDDHEDYNKSLIEYNKHKNEH